MLPGPKMTLVRNLGVARCERIYFRKVFEGSAGAGEGNLEACTGDVLVVAEWESHALDDG